jgi:UDP-3-O-[3-hydroxymyristoyl] N-acetylglucosamine deacetylase
LSQPLVGIGIHGGRSCSVWLHRDDGPLRFRLGRHVLPADLDAVVDTQRCTVLGGDGARLATVEHLLAACHAAGYWAGLLIEVDGDELPILDGSAVPWAERLVALGPPPPPPLPLALARGVAWRDGDSWIRLRPGPTGFDVSVAFDHPAIGRQRWRGGPPDLGDLMGARTFGFAHELESLRRRGLATGAVVGSGILFGDEGPSTPLRSPDEPVRHKALDAIGDFALLGRPLAASVRIHRGSHRAHIAAMRRLRHLAPPPRPSEP